MNLSILYRGPLSSCNYGCDYCPFAKHRETRAEHEADRRALERFVEWVSQRPQGQISVFFTPWGEALIRRRYQQAFGTLSHQPHVRKVVIQTNLSCSLAWVEACDKQRIALWTTYHPSETTREKFLAKCRELDQRDVRYSVGMVGLREYADEIEAMRTALPAHIYLWINAYKRVPEYYPSTMLDRFAAIDPLFPINNMRHPSEGRPCHAGETVISVYGDGTAQRCHFIKQPIGNIYETGFEQALKPRNCTNSTCDCHIGYVHLEPLRMDEVFGNGILERIPSSHIWLSGDQVSSIG
jgi:MoaA/NifB/PqqE/SkfB family radical SAM enzyme